jgi:hypothetical protein
MQCTPQESSLRPHLAAAAAQTARCRRCSSCCVQGCSPTWPTATWPHGGRAGTWGHWQGMPPPVPHRQHSLVISLLGVGRLTDIIYAMPWHRVCEGFCAAMGTGRHWQSVYFHLDERILPPSEHQERVPLCPLCMHTPVCRLVGGLGGGLPAAA